MGAASLTLSHDELLFFQIVLGTPAINGVAEDALAGLAAQEIEARVEAGKASLVERKLVGFLPSRRLQVDDRLVALVGAAAVAEATFLLTRRDSEGVSDSHYFSFTPDIFVEHCTLADGLFRFDHIPNADSVVQRIETLLSGIQARQTVESRAPMMWQETELRAFLVQCRDKTHPTALVPEPRSLDPVLYQEFQQACASRPLWIALSVSNARSMALNRTASIMVVDGARTCWLIRSVEGEAETVSIAPVTGRECIAAVVQMVKRRILSAQPA